jgi:hypothetical protein
MRAFQVASEAYRLLRSHVACAVLVLQIGDGDVTRKTLIPIYMLFPRMFTCPTTKLSSTSVEFEVNIIVNFEDHYSVTENFPLVLVR